VFYFVCNDRSRAERALSKAASLRLGGVDRRNFSLAHFNLGPALFAICHIFPYQEGMPFLSLLWHLPPASLIEREHLSICLAAQPNTHPKSYATAKNAYKMPSTSVGVLQVPLPPFFLNAPSLTTQLRPIVKKFSVLLSSCRRRRNSSSKSTSSLLPFPLVTNN